MSNMCEQHFSKLQLTDAIIFTIVSTFFDKNATEPANITDVYILQSYSYT